MRTPLERGDLYELRGIVRVIAFEPSVVRALLRLAQPIAQSAPSPHPVRRRFPCGPSRCPSARRSRRCAPGSWRSRGSTGRTERGCIERLLGGLDGDQQIGLADALAGGAAHDHLPASFLADQADVLHRGLGAIARAADDAHLDLVRREQIFEAPLQFDAGAGRVLHAEAAELRADAGLHHADALGVRLAGRHAEVGPDLRQVGLLARRADRCAGCR